MTYKIYVLKIFKLIILHLFKIYEKLISENKNFNVSHLDVFFNAYKVQNISQNTTVYCIKYYLGRHVSTLC